MLTTLVKSCRMQSADGNIPSESYVPIYDFGGETGEQLGKCPQILDLLIEFSPQMIFQKSYVCTPIVV